MDSRKPPRSPPPAANSAATDSAAESSLDAHDGRTRVFHGPWRTLVFGICVCISLTHLFFALFAEGSELLRNAFHYAGFAFLLALHYPLLSRRNDKNTPAAHPQRQHDRWLWPDLLLGLAAATAAIYLVLAEDAIYARGVRLNDWDWLAAFVVIGSAIELTRRATGWIIPLMILIALTYIAWWGRHLGGVFAFRGISLETVLFRSIYGDDAIFGTIARISATYVFLFIIFGAFLLRSGGGDFVVQLARAAAGRLTGGPGLVAVIASGLTGTISGSAVANTASTGVITIPLMRRAGFTPRFSAAVEASASTGGQLMPPIMGAGAFVMASYTQIPYERIVAVSILPALLYFISVAFFVRIESRRLGLKPTHDQRGPSWREAIAKNGASFILPIGVLITLLVLGFSPSYAAVIGIVTVIGASWLTQNPMGPRAVLEALALGARNMMITAVLLCAVGLVVNVIATAGIGNTFSLMIANWSAGNVLIALVLIGLASLVLGMGLPVTAAYIVLATLSAPALAGMIADGLLGSRLASGELPAEAWAILSLAAPEKALAGVALPLAEAQTLIRTLPLEIRGALRDTVLSPQMLTFALLSAHMIIFWLSQDSNVTPPVCLAAFTAAAIAKSPPMITGFTSWKIAKGLYLMPVLFAYTPLLSSDWTQALRVFALALIGLYGLVAALQGWMLHRLTWPARLTVGALGTLCLWPTTPWINLLGALTMITFFALHRWQHRRA